MATLGDIMTPDPHRVERSTTLAEAADVMVHGRFGSVIVTTGSTLVGIFTERDMLRAAASQADVTTETVGTWMTADPITAPPDQDVSEAELTMVQHGFRHLPVVEGGEVVGMVSLRDLFSVRIGR
ncbi:MAG TPA: CBS domain-containing protein [Nitriliruptorales bacterium]